MSQYSEADLDECQGYEMNGHVFACDCERCTYRGQARARELHKQTEEQRIATVRNKISRVPKKHTKNLLQEKT